MRAHLVRAAEIEPARLARWRALASRALEPNPWFEPDVVLALDEVRRDIVLLVAEDGDRMAACVPLVPAASSVWTTPHPMGVPLVDPEGAELAFKTLFGSARDAGWACLKLNELDADGRVTAVMARALGEGWRSRILQRDAEWPVLRRRELPTYVRNALGAKQLHNLERLRRRLEERLGAELRLVDRGGDPAVVEQYLALENSGWKGRRGTALASIPPMARYFRRVCASFGASGRLHSYTLEAGSTTVAVKVMVTAGKGLFELRVAYDESFGHFSPGTLLEVEAVTAFHAGDWAFAITNTNHPTSPLFRVWPDRVKTVGLQADASGFAASIARVLARV